MSQVYRSDRLLAYTDGIFSIALTLLVIDIRLPEKIEINLLYSIIDSWPSMLSFIISFLIITVVWFNHHEMFHNIKLIDYKIIIFNTLLMLNIIMIPYVSSILGRSFIFNGFDSVLACMIYGVWISLGGLPFNLLWNHVIKNNNLLIDDFDFIKMKAMQKHYWKGPLLYFIAALLSILNIWVAISAYILLILLFFIPSSLMLRTKKK